MAKYDYFKQQVAEMERIKAKTAHEEHIIEFRAMCSKMINDAIPDIKQQCLEDCRKKFSAEDRAAKHERIQTDIRIDVKDIRKKIIETFRRAFR